ncbi:GNAT family N-acetyltransferase [Herpetosiphon giganteus]|uniref:GNAT family N-acetyltransferase n=1 Tax=Herpetosiphon giganteus TaxID=2029754 RepID=UPI0019589320|nr:GNAT family N-acetyltransferase [Herpetosiphon giganteus]MBM7845756.1 GNAT superfamily N-acetyltransferase [Herpetosiphon giganteus]
MHDTTLGQIRPYTAADWAVVSQIHDAARPDELRGACDPRAFIPLADDQASLSDFEQSQKFVISIDDQVVGFVGINGKYLGWLYIAPSHYGRGLGRQLLNFALEQIGAGAWTIALAENRRAVELYQRAGFAISKTFESDNAGYPCTCARLERV